jgi:hypothetical protein
MVLRRPHICQKRYSIEANEGLGFRYTGRREAWSLLVVLPKNKFWNVSTLLYIPITQRFRV